MPSWSTTTSPGARLERDGQPPRRVSPPRPAPTPPTTAGCRGRAGRGLDGRSGQLTPWGAEEPRPHTGGPLDRGQAAVQLPTGRGGRLEGQVLVAPGVVAQLVAAIHQRPDEIAMPDGVVAHHVEGRPHVVAGQHGQDPRSELRVGPIVEGQGGQRLGGRYRPDELPASELAARSAGKRRVVAFPRRPSQLTSPHGDPAGRQPGKADGRPTKELAAVHRASPCRRPRSGIWDRR